MGGGRPRAGTPVATAGAPRQQRVVGIGSPTERVTPFVRNGVEVATIARSTDGRVFTIRSAFGEPLAVESSFRAARTRLRELQRLRPREFNPRTIQARRQREQQEAKRLARRIERRLARELG